VSIENFSPATFFAVFLPLWLSQPQLVRLPERSEAAGTMHSFPQSQTHFHLGAPFLAADACSMTSKRPYRSPL